MLAPSLLKCALESAPDAIIIVDAAGRIVFANRAAESLFGYARSHLDGEPVELLLRQRQRTHHGALRAAFLAAPHSRPIVSGLDLRARRRDGTELGVQISLSAFCDGTRSFTVAAIRDVSERKRVEAELLVARQAAEQARQNACEARDAADRANCAKTRFLTTASHDLRQPLQTLALLNGTLRRIADEPALNEAFEQQEHAIGTMSRLVNALLDIGKLESGAIRPEITEFQVVPLLEQLRKAFSGLVTQKGLSQRYEIQPCTLRTDAALLEEVLRNLLANAIKYTERGEIIVRCVFKPPVALIEVADTGIGIPPAQLSLIFNEFFQVSTPSTGARSGYGLGLSIVNRIVTLLGLKLQVQSTPGEGSCFRLSVPASEAPVESDQPSRPTPVARELDPSSRTQRILLIEDEASVCTATALLLRAAGFEVLTGASLEEAFAQLERHARFDLLISDFHLRGPSTGVDVIVEVRERLGWRLPAVLLSGDTSQSVQALEHDDRWRIARKPLPAEELLALINELLST